MDANRAFDVALHHYRAGTDLLVPKGVPVEEQALRLARASAHFSAGTLALALARAQHEGLGGQAGDRAVEVPEEDRHRQPQE